MKRTQTILFMVLVLWAVQQSLASDQPVLKGKITDAKTGEPIANARVMFNHRGSPTLTYGVATDSRGEFKTDKVFTQAAHLIGTVIDVVISAENYLGEEREVLLNPSETEVNVALKKDDPVRFITKEFKIRYRDPGEIFKLISLYAQGTASISEKLRTITISADEERVATVARAIAELDKPLKTIWLEVKLIQASGNGEKEAIADKEIEGILKQLKSLFKFTSYSLIGRAEAMGLEGSHLVFSTVPEQSESSAFDVRTIVEYLDGIIQLKDFHIRTMYPKRSELQTTVNIGDGETVILGASRGDPKQGSMITVVTAKTVK